MRRWRTLFKLSFVMLVIFLLIFKLKNSDVRAEDTSGINVEIYNNNSWVENNKYMYHYDMVITNEGDEDVNGWEISVRIPGENIQVTCEWNINCAVNGDRIVITPEGEYFKHISSGKSINDMGLIISSDTEIVEPTTEAPTESTTEAPTEPVTEVPTEVPTEDKPEGVVEIRRDGKYYLHIGTTYYLAPGQWMCSREDNECIAQGGNVFYIRVDGTYEFTRLEK